MHDIRVLSAALLLMLTLALGASAQSGPGAQDGAAGVLSAEQILESAQDGVSFLEPSGQLDHYGPDGYPEDPHGRLVWDAHEEGPLVFVQDDSIGYLLYAQYVNRQRDAVYLARNGTIVDVLPDGTSREIPYGHGAVKFNSIWVSIVEARPIPHFSDNLKTYATFPLHDLYVGLTMGLMGVQATARYVHTERYAGWIRAGYNLSAGLLPERVRSIYAIPLSVGGGYRFPGAFSSAIGPTLWTVGGELLLGLGDRDNNPATPAVVGLPGATFSVERILYDERSREIDVRTDPRPYNYRVTSAAVEASLYLNLARTPVLLPAFSITVSTNVVGPQIPSHPFKSTQVVFLHRQYREDLQEQIRRREERAARSESDSAD